MQVKPHFKTVSTPPASNVAGSLSCLIRKCAVVLALILALLSSVFGFYLAAKSPDASAADALPIYYVDTLDEIPAGEVFLTDLTSAHASVNIKDSRFSLSGGSQPTVVYNGSVTVGTTYTFTSPFSVDFKEAGYTVDGRKVDVSIAYDKLSFAPTHSTTATQIGVAVFNRLGGNSPFAFYATSAGEPKTKIEATIRITYSDTHELVPNLIQLTFADLDGYSTQYPDYAEGITLGAGFTQTYLRKDHIFDKNKITSSNGRTFVPSQYVEAAGWEEWYMASTYFMGGEAKLTWTGMWCGTEIGASYKGYPEWDAPKKEITGSTEISPDSPITYEISQFLPYTAETNRASSIVITDTLSDIFDMSRTTVRILDTNRSDVSSKWNIEKNGHEVRASVKNAYESPGQHYIVIETYIDPTADLVPYIETTPAPDSEDQSAAENVVYRLLVDNSAATIINGEMKTSNTVTSNTPVYPLLYDLNGGDDRGDALDIYLTEQEAVDDDMRGFHLSGSTVSLSSATPNRDGYIFLGWSESPYDPSVNKVGHDELVGHAISSVTMPSSTKIVYAMWARKPIVRFLMPTGEEVEDPQKLVPGSDAEIPGNPTLTGYTFIGWNRVATSVWEDVDVEAIFEANKYTIVYEPNGGDGVHMPDEEMLYDKEGTIFENSYTRHNYEFIGWNTAPDGKGERYAPGDVVVNMTDEPDGRVYLYAQWEFYIQMPETGMEDGLLLTLMGLVIVSVALIAISRAQKKR